MTRINVIPVSELSDEHLGAEFYELPRALTKIEARYKKGKVLPKIPPNYRMGAGHETFFFDKMLFLKVRFLCLYDECIKRKRNIDTKKADRVIARFDRIKRNWPQVWNYYTADKTALRINLIRLIDKDPMFYADKQILISSWGPI